MSDFLGSNRTVTIRSSKGEDYLEFVPNGIGSYEVTASLSGRVVRNDSVSLLVTPAFRKGLRDFADTRRGQAVLEGTYDFRVAIGSHGHTGAAWVGFVLVDFLYLQNDTRGRHLREGGFVVGGEYVGALVRDLERLLNDNESA